MRTADANVRNTRLIEVLIMTFWATPGGAAAITSAAGLVGGSMGGGYSAGANKLNRKTMYRQYRLNRDMRATATQDRMKDLAKAGLNPILAGKYDAASPGVSALSPFNKAASVGPMAQAAAGIASSAIQAAKTTQETSMIDKLMATAEVSEDLADYFQGMTTNIDAVSNTITDAIGNVMKLHWEGQQAIKEGLRSLADEVKGMAGSVADKVSQWKEGARDIIIQLKQDFGQDPGNLEMGISP